MADSTVDIGLSTFVATRMSLLLAAGQKVLKNTTVAGDTTTGTVKKGASGSATLIFLGVANEAIDNTAGGSSVELDVNFIRERKLLWRVNDGTISAANVFSNCYLKDNQSVTLTATSNSLCGMILKVDSIKGVLVAVT